MIMKKIDDRPESSLSHESGSQVFFSSFTSFTKNSSSSVNVVRFDYHSVDFVNYH